MSLTTSRTLLAEQVSPEWPDSAGDAHGAGPTIASVALIAVLFLVAAALLLPGLIVGPSIDAAVFTDIGGRMLHGVTPYVGVWDHKPPGIYIATVVARAALGWLGPWTAGWLLSLVASVGIGAATAGVLRRLGVTGWARSLPAIAATILASHYMLAVGGGLTEPPATALAGLALLMTLGQLTAARLAAVGILAGLAVLLSVQLLPGTAVVLGLALFKRPAPGRVRGALLLALGFTAPIVIAAGWLLVAGALPAAIDALVSYSGAYRASGDVYGAKLAASVAAWTTLDSLFVIAPALLGAVALPHLSGARRTVAIASLLWIAGSLILLIVQRRLYAHYAIPLAVPLGVLAGLGLERTVARLRHGASSSQRALVAFPLLLSFVISVAAGVVSTAAQLSLVASQNGRSRDVAHRLDDLPAGPIFVWGNVPLLYVLADRTPATRYDYFFPLTTTGYSTPAQVQSVADALATHPPAVIVDAGSDAPGLPGFLPLLIDRPVEAEGRDLDLLDPLRAFVTDHYRLEEIVSGWPIYVLRDSRP